ncbi:MAG TPA: serine hydrolase domain-containing protein [Candidatus Saccharimonadales bacterium]|nr:serine hydrolase domain-containing protein [Candidatus Saccharimonadales bacterium]
MDHEIEERVKKAIHERVTPNAVIGYALPDGQQHVMAFGRNTYEVGSPEVRADLLYDVASITKSIPTSSIILWLIDQKRLGFNDRVREFLPDFDGQYSDEVTIYHLLTYTAILDLKEAGLSTYAERGIKELRRALLHSGLKSRPGGEYWYTNAPAILLGMVAEKIFQKRLNEIAEELFFGPLGMTRTTFTPEQFKLSEIVPSEMDEDGFVQGKSTDEAARVFLENGQPTGVAGLFSTAGDLLTFAQMMVNGGEYEGHRYLSPDIIGQLRTNQVAELGESTGLGWEIGRPYMGRFRDRLFGKGGFTGCSVVMDPEKKQAIVVMASYLYPKRRGLYDRGPINQFRGDLADIVFRT